MQKSYLRFALMLAASGVAMFILMYLNTYEWGHVFWSETRFYATIYMVATMAVIMLGFMLHMYSNASINLAIVIFSVVLFAGSLYLLRSQRTIDDVAYMKGMIPHHSIAILTSRRAQIRDPRVRELADGIIEAQVKEIAEMKALIEDIEENGPQSASAESTEPEPAD